MVNKAYIQLPIWLRWIGERFHMHRAGSLLFCVNPPQIRQQSKPRMRLCSRLTRSYISPPFQLRNRVMPSLPPSLTERCNQPYRRIFCAASSHDGGSMPVYLYSSLTATASSNQVSGKTAQPCPGLGGRAALSWINCRSWADF